MAYVPDIAGKTNYVGFFKNNSFKNFFNGFVDGSFNNFAGVISGRISSYSGGKAPGRKR